MPFRYHLTDLANTVPVRLISLAFATLTAALAATGNEAIFEERLRPVLARNCSSCHGGSEPSGDMAVDRLADLLAGGKHGPAIDPGSASTSLLVQYVRGERAPRMPLGGRISPADLAELVGAVDSMQPARPVAGGASEEAQWPYTAPERTPPPRVQAGMWVRNPIDAYVLARLEAKGLEPAMPAGRRTLARRVHFDLTGLPPAPEDIDAFESDRRPGAYERFIERVLARPEYGERWGRHWLDLARFAESDGFAIDRERPTAWRYRDYVIRAFNRDKPYDLFVKEQLAGDELPASDGGEDSDRLVSLGFLRMGPWEADSLSMQKLRQDFLNELTGVTGSAFLGLTVGCAQCHDHKYDPIPQRDFYRLQAFFSATRAERRPAPYADAENRREMKRVLRRYEDSLDEAEDSLDAVQARLIERFVEISGVADEDDERLETFRKELNVKNEFFRKRTGPIFEEPLWREWLAAKDARDRLAELHARHAPVATAVSDVVPPDVPSVAPTFVMAGGEFDAPGESVEPGFPARLAGTAEPAEIPFRGGSAGRRIALAEWIASPDNPLTARVMVNRIWQHHFGAGLVRTASDFGRNGDRPSHPELLDWLALRFVESGWSVKRMHRLMLGSATYRQSTHHDRHADYAVRDPDNRLLWRMNWLRLDAESIRDSLLSLSGRLSPVRGGPSALLDVPADVAQGFEFFKWFASSPAEQRKRTVYTFQRRSVVQPFMETFDAANMSASCSRRNTTTVAPQALTLLNGDLVNDEAVHFARRVIGEAGEDRAAQVGRAFRLVLGRTPSADERDQAVRAFADAPAEQAVARLGVVLFNLNEFLYLQ